MSNRQQKRHRFAENGQEENTDNSSDLLIPTCSSSSRCHYTSPSNGTQGSQPNNKTSTEKDKDEHIKELCVENKKLRVENQNLHYQLLIHETKNLQTKKQKLLSEIKNLQKEKQKLLSETKNPITIHHYTPFSIGDISLDEGIRDVLFFSTSNDEKMMAVVLSSYDKKNDEDNIVIKTIRLRDYKCIKTITKSLDEYNLGYALGMTKIDGVDVIASAEEDGEEVKFWNINNFEEVASFKCSGPIFSIAPYTQNGKRMVACGFFGGKSIELWDVQSKKRVHTLENRGRLARNQYTFQYEEKVYLLSRSLNLWCLNDENKLLKTLSHDRNVCSLTTVEFGGDVLIFAASFDGKIMSWRMSNLEVCHEFNLQNDGLSDMKPFMSNGKIFLASRSKKGSICVVDTELKRIVHEVKHEDYKFSSLDLYEEDGSVVFVTFDYDKKGLVFFKGHNMQAL